MTEISYEGRVAVVTGAGAGLGRAYAQLLAVRGAKVVVNDLGGDRAGHRAGDVKAADAVVAEIQDAGGTAIACYDSVSDADGAEAIAARALDAFGKVDILVNNAGILRDVSFAKMSGEDWAAVRSVHLDGTVNVTRAIWPHMREARYGRVINTSSAAGLYGNFGQVNYSSAKMGIVGFTRTLAVEGASRNITANVIAPAAASRLTEDTLPSDLFDRLQPEYVAGLVGYLAAEECTDTGRIFAVGGGYVSRVAIMEGQGAVFDAVPAPEDIAARYAEISSLEGAVEPTDGQVAIQHFVGRLNHAHAGQD